MEGQLFWTTYNPHSDETAPIPPALDLRGEKKERNMYNNNLKTKRETKGHSDFKEKKRKEKETLIHPPPPPLPTPHRWLLRCSQSYGLNQCCVPK